MREVTQSAIIHFTCNWNLEMLDLKNVNSIDHHWKVNGFLSIRQQKQEEKTQSHTLESLDLNSNSYNVRQKFEWETIRNISRQKGKGDEIQLRGGKK